MVAMRTGCDKPVEIINNQLNLDMYELEIWKIRYEYKIRWYEDMNISIWIYMNIWIWILVYEDMNKKIWWYE